MSKNIFNKEYIKQGKSLFTLKILKVDILYGWLGWAMVLGSFQCQGILLLLHIVGQEPAVLAAGAGRMNFIFYVFHLPFLTSSLFGRQLNRTATINWPARHDLVVDWAVKLQHKQIIISSRMLKINIRCSEKLSRDKNFWIQSTTLSEFKV